MLKTCRKLRNGFRHKMLTFRQPFDKLSTNEQGKNDHENMDIPPSFRQFDIAESAIKSQMACQTDLDGAEVTDLAINLLP